MSDLYYFYSCNNNDINNISYKNPNKYGGYFLSELHDKLYYNLINNKYQLFNGDIEMIIKEKLYNISNKMQLPCSITQLQHKIYLINNKNSKHKILLNNNKRDSSLELSVTQHVKDINTIFFFFCKIIFKNVF